MKKYDVIVALEGLREARKKWNEAKAKFDSDVNLLMDRLMREAAVNMMSAAEVAQAGGWTRRQVTDRMRRMDMSPKKGKRLLAAQAAQALADNAALLGIEPWEMDHMSPLMYLPMGSQLRALLEDKSSEAQEEVDNLVGKLEDAGLTLDHAKEWVTSVIEHGVLPS